MLCLKINIERTLHLPAYKKKPPAGAGGSKSFGRDQKNINHEDFPG